MGDRGGGSDVPGTTPRPARGSARRPALGLVLVLVAATLFVVNAGVSRVALRAGVSAAELTTARITGTFVVLLLAAAVLRRSALRPPPPRLLALLVLHGTVGLALLQWSYFVAIDRLPVGLALLLEFQAPLLVALWAWLVQHERVTARLWVGLVLASGGLVAATGVADGSLGLDGVGVAAGLLAAVCFATYFLVGEHGVSQAEPLQVVLWSFGIATAVMNVVTPLTSLDGTLLGEPTSLLGRFADVHVPVGGAIAWVVLLGTLAPFGLELVALQHLRATLVTALAMLEPVGVNALGWYWFGESLGTVAVLGGVAVVVGVTLAQTSRPPHPEPPPLG